MCVCPEPVFVKYIPRKVKVKKVWRFFLTCVVYSCGYIVTGSRPQRFSFPNSNDASAGAPAENLFSINSFLSLSRACLGKVTAFFGAKKAILRTKARVEALDNRGRTLDEIVDGLWIATTRHRVCVVFSCLS